jgi:hypothetical protein
MSFGQVLGHFAYQAMTIFTWGFFGTFGVLWAIYLLAKISGYVDDEVYI